jgi:hypothetical protein
MRNFANQVNSQCTADSPFHSFTAQWYNGFVISQEKVAKAAIISYQLFSTIRVSIDRLIAAFE